MSYIITTDGELYHHGVKGMKWGVRRYQNKDGSLTPAGKKRLAEGLRKDFKKDFDKAKTSDEAQRAVEKYKQNVSDAANKVLTSEDKKVVLDARNNLMDAAKKREASARAEIELDDIGEVHAFDYYNKRINEAPEKYASYEADEKLMIFSLNYGRGKAKRENPDLAKAAADYDKNEKNYDKCAENYVKACKDASDKLVGEYGNVKLVDMPGANRTVKDAIMSTVAEMDFNLSDDNKRKR